jgi:hypothetical protein
MLHEGRYGAEDNANVQLDARGNPIYRYYWNGKEVSEAVYEKEVKAVYDVSKATRPGAVRCTAGEIVSRIRGYQ